MKQRWIAHGSRCDPLSAFLDDESGQLTCLSGDVIKHSTIALLLKKPTSQEHQCVKASMVILGSVLTRR
jgi:hypothetical protein